MNGILKKSLGALAATLLLGAPLAAFAATATQNITLAGTIAPPPASCSFSGSPSLSFIGGYSDQSVQTGTDGGIRGSPPTFVEATTTIALSCTNNTAYSVSAIEWSPVSVGGYPAGVSLSNTSYDELFYFPITGTGNGAAQNINLIGTLGGTSAWDGLDRTKHVGAVSGVAQIVVTY